jgi:hypothetical protein
MGGLAHNGGGFVGVDVGIIGNQIGGNWLGLLGLELTL